MDTNRYRFDETPMDIREMFMGLFRTYDHDMFNEQEMMAMVWACALSGKAALDSAILSNGLMLEATVSAARRDMGARRTNLNISPLG